VAVLDLCLARLHHRCLLCVHDRSVTIDSSIPDTTNSSQVVLEQLIT
jgi:hypothetical protein